MKGWAIILMLLMSPLLHAQHYPKREIDLSALVDEIFAIQDDDINYEDLYENYLQLISNPYNLNTVTGEQLRVLYILNQLQISSFLKYREETGNILSVYELQSVEGFDFVTFQKLLPFVSADDNTTKLNRNIFKRIAEEKNNYLLLRWSRTLENQKGYRADSASRYAGSPDRFYARFRVSRPGDFSIGITAEKDAGEQLIGKNNLPDFLSFHAQVQNKARLKNLIVGDYQAQFGQGLTLGSAFGLGKNAEAVTSIRRSNIGFVPYTSLLETGFFRGAAATYLLHPRLEINLMASHRHRDGSVQSDSIGELTNTISSFGFTGLHRTPREIANRQSLLEKNISGILTYRLPTLDAGIIWHHTQFDIPLVRNSTLYNQFQFQGSENTNAGFFFNWNFKNYSFFNEFSQTMHHGKALVAGILTNVSAKLDISFLYRKFDRTYYSFYSNALSENSTPQNETGFYSGWKYAINKKYSLAGYVDFFQFPWLRYRSYSPSVGTEWLLRFNGRPSKSTSFFLQFREEIKQRNSSTETTLYKNLRGTKRNYWINLDYQASPQLKFKSRAQFSTFQWDGQLTKGMILLQDISWDVRKFTFTGRYALFDNDNYDNRLYVHEQDVWLAFSFPPYYGKGVRQYILAEYRISEKLTIWCRWSNTNFRDRDIIGSAGETISGNQRNDVKFQARIKI